MRDISFVGCDERFETALRSCLEDARVERMGSLDLVVSAVRLGRMPAAIVILEPSRKSLHELRARLVSSGERASLIPVVALTREIPEREHDAIADELGIACLPVPLDVSRLLTYLEVAEDAAWGEARSDV